MDRDALEGSFETRIPDWNVWRGSTRSLGYLRRMQRKREETCSSDRLGLERIGQVMTKPRRKMVHLQAPCMATACEDVCLNSCLPDSAPGTDLASYSAAPENLDFGPS